ncbi:PucR family transcriptional regulator [Thermomonospora umbrina]|uniref:PucR-like helix-turn-helix protein n=1 Tax=Thermomonospora umbrina TaxID=111806 RepID=A0A3D9SN22_9ACTN|nr:helix-turn-helix domain-containing protein [Thermomonospora umbrina]REE97332.1 PucR-like helix-turn-helix protein [Thermomonospora umbrina]
MTPTTRIDLQVTGKDLAERCLVLRCYVPQIAAEAAEEILRQTPEYAESPDPRYQEVVRWSTEWTIDHFMALMINPDLPSTDILRFWRDLGFGEACEGRGLVPLQTSLRVGAGVAIRRLTEEADLLGMDTSAQTMAQIADALFTYHNRLTASAAEGHAEASEDTANRFQIGRRRLVDLLVSEDPPTAKIAELAQAIRWPIPKAVGAIALDRLPGERGPLPPDVLVGFHLPEPCLIVPDPEGPGRRASLEAMLQGAVGAIGPAVAVPEAAKSLRWARQALTLVRDRVLPGEGPVFVTDHLAMLMLMQDPDLAARAVERRLAPLLQSRRSGRVALAETLIACFECRFNATEVAQRLHMHPQTIRYRVRKLQDLFGEQLNDPSRHLELHMLLHLWLATARENEAGAIS